ncbi:MAG: hypothetical protein U0636_12340 [Phycisphaerales bacterium]
MTATILLLGSGELGKEFTISAKRLGCRVVAVDRYKDAPAMQVADAHEVIDMLDGKAIKRLVKKHKPDHIVPEIEAIRTEALIELGEGWTQRGAQRARCVPDHEPRRHPRRGRAHVEAAHRQVRVRTHGCAA